MPSGAVRFCAREAGEGAPPARGAWPAPALAAELGCGVGKSREEPTAPPRESLLPEPREGGREEAGREGAAPGSASVAPAGLRPALCLPR